MQARLFRFEILRSLAPTVFEARDPGTGALVTLYEWTPAPADRDAAKLRLSTLAEQLHSEVFTADASLYLAAASAALGREALETLRQQGLFTGVAQEAAPSPPIPVAPPLPPPAPKPAAAPPASSAARPFLLVVVGGVALTLGYLLGKAAEVAPTCPAPITDTASPAALSNETARNRQLEAELAAARLASGTNAEALTASAAVNLLRVRNECTIAVRAAVLYTGFNHQRVAQGWVALAPGETAVVAASPVRDFNVFATTAGAEQIWGSDETNPIETLTTDFLYPVATGLDQADKVTQNTFKVHVNAPMDVSALNCKTSVPGE